METVYTLAYIAAGIFTAGVGWHQLDEFFAEDAIWGALIVVVLWPAFVIFAIGYLIRERFLSSK